MLDGMDFNNQFDFSNTHAPSLLDQRHRISLAAVYRRGWKNSRSGTGRAILSGWTTEQRHGVFFRASLRRLVKSRVYQSNSGTLLAFNNCDLVAILLATTT